MQITFDTSNKTDLAILSKLMDMATGQAQPEVAHNPGSTATGFANLSPEGSGVSGAGEAGANAASEAPAPAPEKKTRAKKQQVVEQPAQETAATDAAPQTEAAPSDKPLTLDEVRAALQSFTADKGVPAGIELLKKYGAGRISELAEGDFAAFVADCA